MKEKKKEVLRGKTRGVKGEKKGEENNEEIVLLCQCFDHDSINWNLRFG